MAKLSDDHCRHVVQIDFVHCVRCGCIATAAFVFDDGTFYCQRCLNFLVAYDSITTAALIGGDECYGTRKKDDEHA